MKKLFFLSLVAGAAMAALGFYLITVAPQLSGDQSREVFVRKGDAWSAVSNQMHEFRHPAMIALTARLLKYDQYIKPGRYVIQPGQSAWDIVRKLRSGNQDAINLTINNVTFIHELAGKVAAKLDVDSLELAFLLNDPSTAAEYGFTAENFPAMFLCNTYSFFWNTSAEGFVKRMNDEYLRFWNEERRAKASNDSRLSPEEVIVLASIVQKETNARSEYRRVAGVYLNRLRRGMLLQADPTVKFAVGDMSLRRILKTHLETDSPYNTYKYGGLPPGPICLPEKDVIEAVLNPENHDYLYFCAVYGSGLHAFARTYDEHLKNARQYHKSLNEQKIYK